MGILDHKRILFIFLLPTAISACLGINTLSRPGVCSIEEPTQCLFEPTLHPPTLNDTDMALSAISRLVTKKVLAVETPEVCFDILLVKIWFPHDILNRVQGAGALVRRSIGSMTLRNLTPFLMLDHFHVNEGAVSLDLWNLVRLFISV